MTTRDNDDARNLPATSETYDPFQMFGAAAVSAGGGGVFGSVLKYSKGEWFAGNNDMMGAELVCIFSAVKTGWICWESGQPLEKQLGFIAEGFQPAKRKDLKPGPDDKDDWPTDDKGQPYDPWSFTIELTFADPKSKDLFTMSLSSKGGHRAAGELMLSFRNSDEKYPIIKRGTDSYKSKQYGRVHVPVFELTGEYVGREDYDDLTQQRRRGPRKTLADQRARQELEDELAEANAKAIAERQIRTNGYRPGSRARGSNAASPRFVW
jgi:hypothetical protein